MKDIIKYLIVGTIFCFIGITIYKNLIVSPKEEKFETALRKNKIKNDSLVQLKNGLYQKLIADTLTIKELRKKSNSLELELENPKIVEVIKFVPKEIEKPIDGIIIKDSIIETEDYYPRKENYFIKYSSKINLKTEKGEGKFSFTPQEVVLGIEQKKDGTYATKTKLPEYLKITDIDVESLPLTREKKDNFGILFGGGAGKDLKNNSSYLRLNTGIRYKKTYLQIGGNSNNTVDLTLTFEF